MLIRNKNISIDGKEDAGNLGIELTQFLPPT